MECHREQATMHNARLPVEEIDRLGQSLYDEKLRSVVETPDYIGKQIVIDVETGDYEIDDDGLAASRRLLAKRPDAPLYGLRIGYNAVYTLGGVLNQKVPSGSG
jgi:hypothetical protein